MGEYHSTCFFSNTSIHKDERAVAIILTPRFAPESRTVTESDTFNQMLGFALEGRCNGRGGLKNIVVNSHMEALLKKQKWYIEEGAGYEHVYTKYVWKSMEDFVTQIARHKLYQSFFKKYRIVEMVMIHQELYLQLMDEMKSRKPFGYEETFEQCIRNKINGILDIMKREDAVVNEKIKKIKDDKTLDESQKAGQIVLASIKKSEFHQLWSNDAFYNLNFMATRYVQNPDDTIIEGILNHIVWQKIMSYSRVGYFCVPGSGGDDCEMMIPYIVAKFVQTLYKKRCPKKEMGRETIFFYDIDDSYLPLLKEEDNFDSKA